MKENPYVRPERTGKKPEKPAPRRGSALRKALPLAAMLVAGVPAFRAASESKGTAASQPENEKVLVVKKQKAKAPDLSRLREALNVALEHQTERAPELVPEGPDASVGEAVMEEVTEGEQTPEEAKDMASEQPAFKKFLDQFSKDVPGYTATLAAAKPKSLRLQIAGEDGAYLSELQVFLFDDRLHYSIGPALEGVDEDVLVTDLEGLQSELQNKEALSQAHADWQNRQLSDEEFAAVAKELGCRPDAVKSVIEEGRFNSRE